MGISTKIEWAESTWNPLRSRNIETGKLGWYCAHVSPGCGDHTGGGCYAEAINRRLGTGVDYRAQDQGQVEIYLDEKVLTQPLRWKRPRKIFPCSMTDLFGEWVTDAMLDRIFAVMALCPQHQFLLLTKRAERMRGYCAEPQTPKRITAAAFAQARDLPARRGDDATTANWKFLPARIKWPLPNCWKGVSVEDQRRADERIPLLLDTPAAVRWLSCEPLLGPVDVGWWLPKSPTGIDWVVCGGESGPGARPMELRWVYDIVSQCQAASVPVFVKQLGSRPVVRGQQYTYFNGGPVDVKPKDRKGGDLAEWPAGLRVREYPR